MFKTNVGLVDRIIRAIIGVALIIGYFIWPDLSYSWAFWLGLIPLATAIVGWCPAYRLVGWSTDDSGKDGKAHA